MSNSRPDLAPGVYLEIGVGANDFRPNPTMLIDARGERGPRRFVSGAHYVGIDRPRDPGRYFTGIHAFFLGDFDGESEANKPGTLNNVHGYMRQAQDVAQSRLVSESIRFLVADAHDLPFADGGVQEVYMCDVLSSMLAATSIERILAESRRVLATSGRLVTRECFTPQWGDMETLPEDIHKAGFSEVVTHGYGTEGFKGLVQEFGATLFDVEPEYNADEMYFAIAKP